MPALDVFDVTRIARQAARGEPSLEIAGVLAAPHGGGYVEILVNVIGRATELSRFVVGAFRGTSEADLLRELSATFRRRVDVE
jgi:hypothetical protein